MELGFSEGEQRMDDNVEGNECEGQIYFSPLGVVFRANLNGGRRGEGEGYNRSINGAVSKLSFSSINLKGAKLPIGPPIVLVGEGSKESRRTGGKGASSVFRGND